TVLLGEPAAPATAASTPAPAAKPAATPTARPVAAAASAASSVAHAGESTRYVGTPAVGTSKAAAAGGLAAVGPEDSEINRGRRRFAWTALAAFLTAWFLAFFRFFLPRTLFEPATSFKVGYAADYGLGVDTKWQRGSELRRASAKANGSRACRDRTGWADSSGCFQALSVAEGSAKSV